MEEPDYDRLKKLSLDEVKAIHRDASNMHRAFEAALGGKKQFIQNLCDPALIELQRRTAQAVLDLMTGVDSSYNEAIVAIHAVRISQETNNVSLADDVYERTERVYSNLIEHKEKISEINELIDTLREKKPELAAFLSKIVSYVSQNIDNLLKTVLAHYE